MFLASLRANATGAPFGTWIGGFLPQPQRPFSRMISVAFRENADGFFLGKGPGGFLPHPTRPTPRAIAIAFEEIAFGENADGIGDEGGLGEFPPNPHRPFSRKNAVALKKLRSQFSLKRGDAILESFLRNVYVRSMGSRVVHFQRRLHSRFSLNAAAVFLQVGLCVFGRWPHSPFRRGLRARFL